MSSHRSCEPVKESDVLCTHCLSYYGPHLRFHVCPVLTSKGLCRDKIKKKMNEVINNQKERGAYLSKHLYLSEEAWLPNDHYSRQDVKDLLEGIGHIFVPSASDDNGVSRKIASHFSSVTEARQARLARQRGSSDLLSHVVQADASLSVQRAGNIIGCPSGTLPSKVPKVMTAFYKPSKGVPSHVSKVSNYNVAPSVTTHTKAQREESDLNGLSGTTSVTIESPNICFYKCYPVHRANVEISGPSETLPHEVSMEGKEVRSSALKIKCSDTKKCDPMMPTLNTSDVSEVELNVELNVGRIQSKSSTEENDSYLATPKKYLKVYASNEVGVKCKSAKRHHCARRRTPDQTSVRPFASSSRDSSLIKYSNPLRVALMDIGHYNVPKQFLSLPILQDFRSFFMETLGKSISVTNNNIANVAKVLWYLMDRKVVFDRSKLTRDRIDNFYRSRQDVGLRAQSLLNYNKSFNKFLHFLVSETDMFINDLCGKNRIDMLMAHIKNRAVGFSSRVSADFRRRKASGIVDNVPSPKKLNSICRKLRPRFVDLLEKAKKTQKSDSCPLDRSEVAFVNRYLCLIVVFGQGARPGVIENMRVSEYTRAVNIGKRYGYVAINVAEHKTSEKFAAIIHLDDTKVSWFSDYFTYVRQPIVRLTVSESDSFLLTYHGLSFCKASEGIQVLQQNAGMTVYSATMARRSIEQHFSTYSSDTRKEIATLLAHSEEMRDRRYIGTEIEKRAKAFALVDAAVRGTDRKASDKSTLSASLDPILQSKKEKVLKVVIEDLMTGKSQESVC